MQEVGLAVAAMSLGEFTRLLTSMSRETMSSAPLTSAEAVKRSNYHGSDRRGGAAAAVGTKWADAHALTFTAFSFN